MNEDFGIDFVARCIAGESLEVANSRQWKLTAGANIHLDNNPSTETTTISADAQTITVDDELSSTSENPVQNKVIYNALQNVEIDVDNALSLVSENPVQNKVITAEVNTKPTCVLPNGTVLSGQKLMALTKAQYDAIQNKDANTYYYITDDAEGYSAGTGIDITNGVISLDADYGAGIALTLNSSTYVLTANLLDQNGTPLGAAASVDLPLETMVVGGSYDDATQKVILTLQNGSTVEFSVADLVDGLESSAHAAATYATQATVNALDVVPDVTSSDDNKVLTASYSGGVGSYAWEAVQNQIPPYGPAWALHVLSINSAGDNVIWRALNEVPQATSTDIGKVLAHDTNGSIWTSIDEVPDVTSSDDGKILAADYTGGVGSYSWETASGLGLATSSDISDMATQTWVGQQGYITSADEVPAVTSSDDGKVLKATYSGGAGSYAWGAVNEVPDSPNDGVEYVLQGYKYNGAQSLYWSGGALLPPLTAGNDGDVPVLSVDPDFGTRAVFWQAPPAGGLQVETDGTNYWITVNGIRLYFASSAPTGTIPNGSVGIGW